MTKEIGETKTFTKARLLNPLPKQDIPDNYKVSELVIFHKDPITVQRLELIQREVQKILGRSYYRSYLST